jgi:hypothetical protein
MTDMSCRAGVGAGATGWVGMGMIGICLCPWQIGGQDTVDCKILEPVLPRELLPFDRGLLGGDGSRSGGDGG